MSQPYGVLSDQHCHAWSAFAQPGPDGVNSRLKIILDEMARAADEVVAAGGDTLIFAGDLFHVRGSIKPEVFNPTHDAIERMLGRVKIKCIPGNHDLATNETTELGNAMQTLAKLPGFSVITQPERMLIGLREVVMLPWQPNLDVLRAVLKEFALLAPRADCFIHAPVNGVLMGIPDHGLSGEELAELGFGRVFSGHYHHHKMVAPNVYSIGATTHQTWSDVGTHAGFLLVSHGEVRFRAARAPHFVDIDADMDPDDMLATVDGNYVRAKITAAKGSDVVELRKQLEEMGAAGVTIIAQPKTEAVRTGSTVSSGATLEGSINDYIGGLGHARPAALAGLCSAYLNEARKGLE